MVETRFQTSFIPKRPQANGVAYRRDQGGMGFFAIIATILFIIAALACLGLFFYGTFLKSSIATKDAELRATHDALDKTALNTFKNLGRKTASAENILSRHVAFSRVADFLESVTLRNVRYKSFTFETVPGNTSKISLKGEAQSYAAVASQAYVLSIHDSVASVSFGALTLDDKGTVSFDALLTLKPEAVTYKASLDELSLIPVTQ